MRATHLTKAPSLGHCWPPPQSLACILAVLLIATGVPVSYAKGASQPGGAGHALLFNDHVIVKKDFKGFPRTALTFEAWIASSDFCHAGTIMSYAKDSKATDVNQRVADFNHFLIFDPRNILACHDFQYIDMIPDPKNESCHATFTSQNKGNSGLTASLVERDGSWHHLAVTWSAAEEGLTSIYMDGLLMSSAKTHKTAPLDPNGAFMLGGEQDCFGGCTDPSQGYHGRMDEVRLWSVARSQSDILRTMRWAAGLEKEPGLVGWWKFDEPNDDEGQFRHHTVALDSSGKGNHLPLLNPPIPLEDTINMPDTLAGASPLKVGTLQFRNNFALTKKATQMPGGSFTLEMWARGAAVGDEATAQRRTNLLSYATEALGQDGQPSKFMDDALRLERVLADYAPSWLEPFFATSTAGSVVLHINSNEHTDSADTRSWIYFDAGWKDAEWHHIAASWDVDSGKATLLFDGVEKKAFWKSDWGNRQATPIDSGGVDATLAPHSRRKTEGALVLGQDQDCYGGCFSPSDSFFGDMAMVRIWRKVVTLDEVRRNMNKGAPENSEGLAALYTFGNTGVRPAEGGGNLAMDSSGANNHLALRSSPPMYVYSTAPLSFTDGRPVGPPLPGAGGYSLRLNDKQVLLRTGFAGFPDTALTLEFWMWSIDTCRPGVPFSYAAGEYERRDNAFLLFNYNSWGVSVMEDEGTLGDHQSGVSATDGNWHHVAVTWESSTGQVVLYDNGRPMWTVTRGKGKRIPSGGTLVIGREQDCMGGCFDSAAGAAGRTSEVEDQEYGPQDFFGVIEEMRLWKVARTPAEIRQSMAADDGRGPGGFLSPGVDANHPDLVAYYKFDEGTGYVVRDVTGKGHDLLITQPPEWEVTRWLSTCGNAVVEGMEECDDGDLTDGDGCSASCTIEEGWVCSGSPSHCKRKDHPPLYPPGTPPHYPPSGEGTNPPPPSEAGGARSGDTPSQPLPAGGDAGGSGKRKRGGWIAGVVVLSVLVAGVAGTLMYLMRGRLVDAGASVASSVGSVTESLLSHVPGADSLLLRTRQGYSPGLTYDPVADAPHAPDFMAMSPAPRGRAYVPGAPGPYVGLGGGPGQTPDSPAPAQPPRGNTDV